MVEARWAREVVVAAPDRERAKWLPQLDRVLAKASAGAEAQAASLNRSSHEARNYRLP